MSEIVYINDPRGGRVPLTDEFGNLSIEVMFLYNEDKLPAEDKAKVDAIVANDEMAKDALEGFALMNSAPKAKAIVGDIGKEITTGKPSRKAAVVPMFSARSWAIAASLIIVVGIGSVLVSRVLNQDQLAMNEEQSQPVKTENKQLEKAGRSDFNLASDTIDKVEESENFDHESKEEPTVTLDIPEEVKDKKSEETEQSKERDREQPMEEDGPVQASPAPIMEDSEPVVEKETEEQSAEEKRAELMAKISSLRSNKARSRDSDQTFNEESEEVELADDDMNEQAKIAAAVGESGADSREEIGSIRGARSSSDIVDVYTDAAVYYNFNSEELEVRPTFPGGDVKMYEYIESNKKHSENLKSQGVGGEVFVSFMINEKGKVTNVEILTSKVGSPQLENDAKRVIRSMPRWTPGKKDGNPVKVRKTMMVKYPVE